MTKNTAYSDTGRSSPDHETGGSSDSGSSDLGELGDRSPVLGNRMVWRGQTGHYEVWFLTVTHTASRTGFWLRYTLDAPSVAPGGSGASTKDAPFGQLWFCRADANDADRTFGIHRRFPLAAVRTSHSPFEIDISGARLTQDATTGRMRGALSGGGHEVRWDLAWPTAERTHLTLPRALYRQPVPVAESLVLAPNLSVPISGVIEVDGERYELRGEPGGQSHLWGRKHAYAWAWARCNAFSDDSGDLVPAALEALTVRLRRGPVVVTPTMLSVFPDGFGGKELAFREWHHMPLSRAEYRTGYYAMSAQNAIAKAEATFTCRPEDMVRCEYVDPDGAPAYVHFAATAACELRLYKRSWPGAAWQLDRELRTPYGGQFEWAGRAGDSQVRTRHQNCDDV